MASNSLEGSNNQQNNNGYNSFNDLLEGVAASSNEESNVNSFHENNSNEYSSNENSSSLESNEEDASNAILEEEGVEVDDEIDEIPVVEGAAASGVQVASAASMESDPDLGIQLGDAVAIDSELYGRTEGVVYYNDANIMSIKPIGVENMVRVFDMTEDGFDEKYGVRVAMILEKRKYDSFVEQQDLRVGQLVDTFDKNGELFQQYRVIQVNEEADSVTLQGLEGEAEEEIVFGYVGIPLDAPFQVISVRQYIGKEEKKEDGNAENGELLAEAAEEKVEESSQEMASMNKSKSKSKNKSKRTSRPRLDQRVSSSIIWATTPTS